MDNDEIGPKAWWDPTGRALNVSGTDPEKDNVAGEITVGILQSHDINIKTDWRPSVSVTGRCVS